MYKEYFEINKNFQSSVNLELDFGNEEKIAEYIPTNDICDVLKRYIKAVLGISKEKATTLVGPYGKGKSFLLLVLSFLFSKNKESKYWINLVNKFKNIDTELFELLINLKEKNTSLIPVIINSNYNNLSQSFLLALNEALKREHLEEIIPTTVYSVCIDLIDKWNKDERLKNELLLKCLQINKISLDELKKELKEFSPSAYKKFESLYNCVNIGLKFNPLVSDDIVKTYSDICLQLPKYGYNGMFIIFDEFSKFIESTSADVMKDLKIIQDMAEMCSRTSKTSQSHLCCVAHKSISLYSFAKSDSFKTVEGRFSEIRFNRSLEENYQIISSAIIKNVNGTKLAQNFVNNNLDFYRKIKDLNLFNDQNFENVTINTFPLNPLTSFSLIQLSELVAQNERTLFTFISDTDDNSFNSFIANNNEGLFNVDKIYDYFSSLLQKEEANYIRNIWYRSESILSKLKDYKEKKIIKCLAIILMLNDYDRLAPTSETLSLCSFEKEKDVEKIIEDLINKHYLRKNILNNLISFALSNTKHIDEKIEILENTKFKNVNYSSVLNEINDKQYEIPRKYNEENKITRFFKVIYLSEKEFMALNNFDVYFENNFCDGLVLKIIRQKLSTNEINNKIKTINNERIVAIPSEDVPDILFKELLRYSCLKEISNEKAIDEITKEELALLSEETIVDLRTLITSLFKENQKLINSRYEIDNLNLLLSTILQNYYPKSPIFNNELVNKKNVSSQYQKAVNNVIDWLINNDNEFIYSETSPENSVKNAVITVNKDNAIYREVIDLIKSMLLDSNGKKVKSLDIYDVLSSAPYGIRDGIIPLLIAVAISELSDNVLLYYQTKEILLNSNNLVKSLKNDSYSFVFSKGSIEQQKYLSKLLEKFNLKSSSSFRLDTISASEGLKKYFMSLPSIFRSSTQSSNLLNLDEQILGIKDIFMDININPYESIFVKPKLIFGVNSYKDLYEQFEELDKKVSSSLINYKLLISNEIKKTFEIDQKTSLKTELSNFIRTQNKDNKILILSDSSKNIYNVILNFNSYNDGDFANELCKACCNYFIEDWDKDNLPEVILKLNSFKTELVNKTQEKNALNLTGEIKEQEVSDPMSILLNNNIESVLDEFSDSISNEEKVKVLMNIIKRIL